MLYGGAEQRKIDSGCGGATVPGPLALSGWDWARIKAGPGIFSSAGDPENASESGWPFRNT